MSYYIPQFVDRTGKIIEDITISDGADGVVAINNYELDEPPFLSEGSSEAPDQQDEKSTNKAIKSFLGRYDLAEIDLSTPPHAFAL